MCPELSCYDCAMTSGVCNWSKTTNSCSLSVESATFDAFKLIEAFEQCGDSLNYCTSNVDVAKKLTGDTKTSMSEDFSLYYTIGTNQGG